MSYIRQIQQSQPNKRRRHDESNVFTSINGYSRHISTKSSKNPDHKADGELRIEGSDSLYLDLSTLPPPALHKYMTNYGLAAQLPPRPRDATAAVVLPFALRPSLEHYFEAAQGDNNNDEEMNEEMSDNGSTSMRRRPSRKTSRSVSAHHDDQDEMLDPEDMEEEAILADVDDAHQLFNKVVSSHYREQNVREVDSVVSFVHALRSKSTDLILYVLISHNPNR
ncbi:hypothetical protein E3Q24_04207 [Wallemia mellicola]|nr:hypothetical protein E3Q24_04207 [Wallemia mellicola]